MLFRAFELVKCAQSRKKKFKCATREEFFHLQFLSFLGMKKRLMYMQYKTANPHWDLCTKERAKFANSWASLLPFLGTWPTRTEIFELRNLLSSMNAPNSERIWSPKLERCIDFTGFVCLKISRIPIDSSRLLKMKYKKNSLKNRSVVVDDILCSSSITNVKPMFKNFHFPSQLYFCYKKNSITRKAKSFQTQ